MKSDSEYEVGSESSEEEERRQRQLNSSDDEVERPTLSVQTHSCLQLSKHLWEEEKESEKKNFCFSPLSIYVILSLIASGSSGRTLEQMLQFLNSDSIDRLNSIGSQLIESVSGGSGEPAPSGSPPVSKQKKRKRTSEKRGRGGGGPILSFMSEIWVEKSPCALKPHFKEIVASIYKAKARSVDFTTQANEVREEVNKWVEKQTNGLIKELLPPKSIDQRTRLVLANALYFKGEWNKEFDPTQTKKYKFHLLNGVGSVRVPFMTNNENQFVSCFKGFKVLKLPYKHASTNNDRRFSMYIFLPDERDGLGNLIQKASSDSGFLDCHLPERKVKMGTFRIPKFKISFGFEASKVLKKLGITSPFNPSEAELNEMVDGENNRLYVSSIHHKCFVEVDEVGTKAAATTAAAGQKVGLIVWFSTVDFVADHPFLFFIRDDQSGVVLFIGHVLNPLF